MKIGESSFYEFLPQTDITAWDIAFILKISGFKICENIYEVLPEGLKKHFNNLYTGLISDIEIYDYPLSEHEIRKKFEEKIK